MIKVDKRVQIPEANVGRKAKYPWSSLKVGDSFFIDNYNNSPFSLVRIYNKKRAKKDQIKITTRKEGKGLRVWRIE